MGLNMLILVMTCLLLLACVAVKLTRKNRPDTTKQIKAKEAVMESEDADLFWIEHVPIAMRKLESRGFVASATTQAGLVEAGFTLLRKLPTDIRDPLSCPVSADLAVLLAQGANANDLTPERVRAAVAVAEASLALWALMFEFDKRVNPPHRVALGKQIGVLFAGQQIFAVGYVIARISYGTGVSQAVATSMWRGIVEILREGQVNIPGLRAVKSEVEKG